MLSEIFRSYPNSIIIHIISFPIAITITIIVITLLKIILFDPISSRIYHHSLATFLHNLFLNLITHIFFNNIKQISDSSTTTHCIMCLIYYNFLIISNKIIDNLTRIVRIYYLIVLGIYEDGRNGAMNWFIEIDLKRIVLLGREGLVYFL